MLFLYLYACILVLDHLIGKVLIVNIINIIILIKIIGLKSYNKYSVSIFILLKSLLKDIFARIENN